jgi:hypothetical protein
VVTSELQHDAATKGKTFVPDYGEFIAGGGGDLEAVVLAVPTDAVGGSTPAELTALTAGARASFDATGTRRWAAASSRVDAMDAAWKRARGSGVPELLADQLTGALDTLTRADAAGDLARARQAALRSSRPPSTSNSATGRQPRSTWTAWTCGPASSRSTPPPRTRERSPATPPPPDPLGTAPATPPTRRPANGSACP